MICLRITEGGGSVAQSEKWDRGGAVSHFPAPAAQDGKGSKARCPPALLCAGHALASVSALETRMSQGKLPSCQGYATGLPLDESAINSRLSPGDNQ